MAHSVRSCFSVLTASLLLAPFSSAFESPLSDHEVREAYFLGQRRDETMARLLNGYTKFLTPPSTGPHIHAITFLTPFALLVQHCSRQSNYSAQQAAKEHHAERESVVIQIEILLTQSYGPFITKPTSPRSDAPVGIQLRSPSFWRDIEFRVFDGVEERTPDMVTGQPNSLCGFKAGCRLTGATIRLEFPANAFSSDWATIEVTPPQGDPVSVNFDLSSLR